MAASVATIKTPLKRNEPLRIGFGAYPIQATVRIDIGLPRSIWVAGLVLVIISSFADVQGCSTTAQISACSNSAWNCAGLSNCLDCSGLAWSSFPCATILPFGLEYLYLIGNSFTSITNYPFGGSGLFGNSNGLNLYLDDNLISVIATGAFSSVYYPQILSLRGNKLTTLQANMFNSLAFASASGQLWLDRNEILTISPGAFNGISNLYRLYLTSNVLTDLEASMFDSLAFGTVNGQLYLDNNNIRTIAAGTFSGISQLEAIILSGNMNMNISTSALSSLSISLLNCGQTCCSTTCSIDACSSQCPNSAFCQVTGYLEPSSIFQCSVTATSSSSAVAIGASIGAIGVVIIIVVIVVIIIRRRRKPRPHRAIAAKKMDTRRIDPQKILIDSPIGSCCLGELHKARLTQGDGTFLVVIVQSPQQRASEQDLAAMKAEASMLLQLPHHLNIASFVGHCLTNFPPLLVFEFCQNGNLRDWLREGRSGWLITNQQAIRMINEILSGLNHLHCNNLIHGALAAQSVLLSDTLTCKLFDFGMQKSQTLNQEEMIRWKSPEVISNPSRISTTMTDIWSFGVVLWEFISMGATPYSQVSNENVLAFLNQGGSLPMPIGSLTSLYSLVQACCAMNPLLRPSINVVMSSLSRMKIEAGVFSTQIMLPIVSTFEVGNVSHSLMKQQTLFSKSTTLQSTKSTKTIWGFDEQHNIDDFNEGVHEYTAPIPTIDSKSHLEDPSFEKNTHKISRANTAASGKLSIYDSFSTDIDVDSNLQGTPHTLEYLKLLEAQASEYAAIYEAPSAFSAPAKSVPGLASRLTEDEEYSTLTKPPIFGLKAEPVIPIEDAVRKLKTPESPQLGIELIASGDLQTAINATKTILSNLTHDEAAAIYLYTMETLLYRQLNAVLRNEDREAIKPCFAYLKILLCGLYKLPLPETWITCFRGVKQALPPQLRTGAKFPWWSITSTTKNIEVLRDSTYLGKDGDRVLYHISSLMAINIMEYSFYQRENEMILIPGTTFEVEGVLDAGNGLYMVTLKQCRSQFMLDFPHPQLKNLVF